MEFIGFESLRVIFSKDPMKFTKKCTLVNLALNPKSNLHLNQSENKLKIYHHS